MRKRGAKDSPLLVVVVVCLSSRRLEAEFQEVGELGLSSGNMLSLRNPLGITVGDVK